MKKEVVRERELAQVQALEKEQRRRLAEQARGARRLRRLAIALAGVLLVAVGAALLAWNQRQKAQLHVEQAVAARQHAEERRSEAERLATAEAKARAEAERLRLVSITKSLFALAPRQHEIQQDERGALLARQAYLFDNQTQTYARDQVDESLRAALSVSHFSAILRGHSSSVMSIAFNLDGQFLASGSTDKTIHLWNLTTAGASSTVLRGHEFTVWALAFSPDGKTLASGSGWQNWGTILLWDLADLDAQPIVLRGLPGMQSLAFSQDGKLRNAGGGLTVIMSVRLWDLNKPNELPIDTRGLQRNANSVAFSPDGKTLAAGSTNDIVRLWNLTSLGAPPTVLRHHDGGVMSFAFSPDGKILAPGNKDGTVRLWDPVNPQDEPIVLRGHETQIQTLAFSPDSKTLASGNKDRTIHIWELTNSEAPPTVMHGHEDWVRSVQFSPSGKILASASDDTTVRLWDLAKPIATPTSCLGTRILSGRRPSARMAGRWHRAVMTTAYVCGI